MRVIVRFTLFVTTNLGDAACKPSPTGSTPALAGNGTFRTKAVVPPVLLITTRSDVGSRFVRNRYSPVEVNARPSMYWNCTGTSIRLTGRPVAGSSSMRLHGGRGSPRDLHPWPA